MQRKGQAALEFLTTYGWAFLVILVMIGALAYFGVLDPSRFLPNRCQFETGIGCEKYILDDAATDTVSFQLKNNLGEGIVISRVQIMNVQTGAYENCGASTAQLTTDSTPTTLASSIAGSKAIPKNAIVDVTCTISNSPKPIELTNGEKIKVNLMLNYNKGIAYDATYTTTMSGEIYASAN